MLTENAKVVAVDDDGLWVETLKQSACGACSAKSGCGQHLLVNYLRDMTCIKAQFGEVGNRRIWRLGDQVEIGVEESALVVNALLVYLLPLVCLIIFVAVTHALALPEVLVALSGFSGLFLAGLLIKLLYPYMLKKRFRSLEVFVLSGLQEM